MIKKTIKQIRTITSKLFFSRETLLALAATFVAAVLIVTAPNLQAANAVTIRSASSDGCTIDIGTAGAATITRSGNNCVVTVTGSTTVQIPNYISTMAVLAVGGGGGGGQDGGAGGGGGEVRYSDTQQVTAGGTATITIGAGGAGGSWGGGVSASGGQTSIIGANLTYYANGGGRADGWSLSGPPGGAAGSGGSGGTGYSLGAGGAGPYSVCNPYTIGSVGSSGPQLNIPGLGNTYFAGGGGGGSGHNTNNSASYYGFGVAGGNGGGGRGANLRYAVDDTTWIDGASPGHNATYYGGGGGGGSACNARGDMNLGYDGVSQRTAGGNGFQGVVILSFVENRLALTTAPEGCLANVTENCVQSGVIQLQDGTGNNITTSGVSVVMSTSAGNINGSAGSTLTVATTSGVATFSFYLTGLTVGNTATLTFETVGYRNIQTTITMRAYSSTLTVVSGSTDTTGMWVGTTGVWVATATDSNISVTTLANELSNRDVTLRAYNSSASSGDITLNSGTTLTSSASATRTLTIKTSRNIFIGGRITTASSPLNVIIWSDTDNSNGGAVAVNGGNNSYALETKGGSVAIGGGNTTVNWNSLTIPSGFATGVGASTGNWWGVQLGVNTDTPNQKLISTSNGGVRIYGQANGSTNVTLLYGVAWESGAIDAGSGTVSIAGQTTLSPSVATNDNYGVGLGVNYGSANDTVNLNSGGVNFTSYIYNAGTSNVAGVFVKNSTVSMGSGTASFSCSSGHNVVFDSGNTFNGTVNSSPGGDTKVIGATTFNGITTLNGKKVSVSGAISTNNNLTLYANTGDVTVSANITNSGSSRTLTLRSVANVVVSSGALSTQAGDILVSSDTDNASDGGIKIANGASLASNGGAITLAGGDTNGTGYAKGTSVTVLDGGGYGGIFVAGSVSSTTGNIVMRGQDSTSMGAEYGAGIQINRGATISSTSGSITINGRTVATNTDITKYHLGVVLGWSGTGTAQITSTTGAISVTGDASNSAFTKRLGIGFYGGVVSSTASSNSGAISLTSNSTLDAANFDFYTNTESTNAVSSTSGSVTFTSGTSGSASNLTSMTITGGTGVTLDIYKPVITSLALNGASPKIIESPSGANSFYTDFSTSGMTVDSSSTSLTIGRSTNTSKVTIAAALQVAGPIAIYAGQYVQSASLTTTGTSSSTLSVTAASADLNGTITSVGNVNVTTSGATSDILAKQNITVSGAAASLTLKSQQNIDATTNAVTLQTNKGPLVLWSDADGSTDTTNGGAIWIEAGSKLNSANGNETRSSTGGGNITLGGGTAGTTAPTGSSTVRVTTGSGTCAVQTGLGGSATSITYFYTGGGKLSIKGSSATSNHGVCFDYGVVAWANDNQIAIDGQNSSTGGGVTVIRNQPTVESEIYSSSATVPAISITGSSQSLFGVITGFSLSTNNLLTIQSTGAGGVSVSGSTTTPSATWPEVGFSSTDLLSAGPITVNTSTTNTNGGFYTAKYGSSAVGTTENIFGYCDTTTCPKSLVTSSSANITITSNVISTNSGASNYMTFNTAGALVLQPLATTGFKNLNLMNNVNSLVESSDMSGLTIGKNQSTNADDVTVYHPISIAGAINIYAGNVTVSANLTSSLASARINVKASGNVTVGANVALSNTAVGGGPIILWSDCDANSSGYISSQNGASYSSNGGSITLAGGLDNGAATVESGRVNNDGFPDGYTYGATGSLFGVDFGAVTTMNSAGGAIFVAGHGQEPSTSVAATGIQVGEGTTINGGAGKIHMYGQANSSGAYTEGIRLRGVLSTDRTKYVNITNSSTASDAIVIVGDSSASTGARAGGILAISWAARTDGGPKNVIANSSSGGVTLTGRSGNTPGITNDAVGSGLELCATAVLSKSGAITLNGDTAASATDVAYGFTSNHINVASFVGASSFGAQTTPAYTLNGVDMSTSSANITWNVDSFYVPNSGTSSTTVTTTGTVAIQPASNGAAITSFDRAVSNSGLTLSNANTGFTLGRAGNTSDITIAAAVTSARSVEIAGGAVSTSANITAGSTYSVLFRANSLALGTSNTVSAPSGVITITPTTATTPINVGTETAGSVSVVAAELSRLSTDTLRFGASGGNNSGNITVSIALTPTNFTTLALRTSGSVTSSSALTIASLGVSAGGDVTLTGQNNTTTLAITTSKVSPTVSYTEATGQTYTPGTVDGITANFGTVNSFTVASAPTSGYVNQVFSSSPVVTLKDLYGVTISSQNATTNTVTASTSSAGFTLGGTTSIANQVGGTFTFNNLKVTAGTGTLVVNFAVTGVTSQSSVSTGSITIQAGDPDRLVITTAPAGGASGAAFTTQPVVEIRTSSNTVVTTSPGTTLDVTASLISGTGALVGAVTKQAVAGVATFTNLGIGGYTNQNYTIRFTAVFNSTNITVDSATITITAGAATKLALTTPAAGFVSGAAFTTQPAVTVQDYYGNTVTTWATAITATLTGGSTLNGTNTATPTSGVATFAGLSASGLVTNSNVLTFTSGVLASDSQTFTLTFGAATQLVITTSPAGFVNRSNFTTQPVVAVKDAAGNTVTTDNSTSVTAYIDQGSLTGTRTLTAVNGVLDWSTAATPLGTQAKAGYRIIYFDGGGYSQARHTFLLTHGAATKIATLRAAGASASGTPLYYPSGPQVNVPTTLVTDGGWTQCYNQAFNGSGTTLETQVLANCTGTYILAAGRATGSGTLMLAAAAPRASVFTATTGNTTTAANGSNWYYVTGSAMGFSSSTVSLGQCDGFYIRAYSFCTHLTASGGYRIGSLTGLNGSSAYERVYYQSNGTTVTGQQTNDVTLTTQPMLAVQDADGNTVTTGSSSTGTITAESGTALSGTTTINITNGLATFSDLKYTGTSGSRTITYTMGTTNFTTSETLTVNPGAATKLGVTRSAAGAVNGVAFTTQPQVAVQDVSGNTVSSSTASIGVSITGPTLSGTTPVTAVSGTTTFAGLTLTGTAGTYTLTFTSNGLSQTTQSIELTFGAATKLAFKTQAAGFVNRTAFTTQPEIYIQDASGNTVTSSNASVLVSIDTGTLTGTRTVAAVNGVVSFAGLGKTGTIGSKTLDFTSTGLTHITQTFVLTHGAATQLVIATQAAGAQAGIAFATQPVLEIRDADNNVVTSGPESTLTARSSSTNGTLTGTTDKQAVAGVITYTNLMLSNATGSYNLSFGLIDTGYTSFTTSQSLSLAAGTAVKLGMVSQPSSGGASGSAFATQPSIEVLDAFNNRVLTDTGRTITASYAGANGGTLSGSPNLTASTSSGLATFSGLKFVGTPGTNYSLHFAVASDTLTATDSNTFTVTFAAASQIVILQQPIGGNAVRSPLTVQPVVEIQDQYGNPITSGADSTRVVTIAIASANGGNAGSLALGSITATAVNGRATFSNVILSSATINNNYTFSFSATLTAGSRTSAASNAVQVVHAAADHLTVATTATGAAAGIAFTRQPVIEVRDVEENVVTDGNKSNAIIIASIGTGATLSGDYAINAVNGVATFTNLLAEGTANSYTLSFATPGLTTVTQSLTLTYGNAHHLGITTQPGGGHATGAAFTTAPVVKVYDAYDNVVGNSTASVVATIASGAGGSLTSATKAAVNGIADFSALRLVGTPGTAYTLAFASTGLAGATSQSFTVTYAAASQLVLVTQPYGTNMTGEDLTGQPVLNLKDQYGNLITGDNSSVITAHISTGTGGSLSGATATASGGVVTFAHLKLVGTPGVSYTLNFTTASITSADSNAITVTNNVATQIVLSTSAAGARAGLAFTTQPIVTVKDAYGNVVQTGVGSGATITASISSGGALVGTASIAANQGVATFTNLGIGALSNTYTITYSSDLAQSLNVTATQSATVTYGNADHLMMNRQPVGGKTGDVLTTVPIVYIVDVYGNKVDNSTASVTASLSTATAGDVVTGTSVNAVNGVATFSSLNVRTLPGTRTLTFTSNSLTSVTSASFTITHADASKLMITTQPVGGNATGDRLTTQPVVEIRDRFDNVATSNSDIITITSSAGGSLSTSRTAGETSIAAVAGVATFTNVRLVGTPGTAYSLTFSTGSLTPAVSNSITLTFSTAHQLAIVTQPVAGKTAVAFTTQPVIQVLDYYGNLVANDNSTSITAAISSGANGILTGTQTITAVNGVATFTNLALTGTPGANYRIGFTSSPLVAATSQNVTVTAGDATHLRITLQPVGAITGKNLSTQPVVELLDYFDNRVTADGTSVITAAIASGANGSLSGSTTATAVNGVATFSGLKLTGTPMLDYTLVFSSGSLATDTSSALNVTHDAAAAFVWVTQPVADATGNFLPTQPRLKLVDQYGNLASSNNSTLVTASLGSGAGGIVSGTTTATASGGYVQFNGLVLIGTPLTVNYTISFAATGINPTTSQALTVTHNVPARLVVLTQPVGALSANALGTQPVVEVQDAYGNRTTSDSSTVVTAAICPTATCASSGSGGAVGGSVTATDVNGVATFIGLTASGVPGTTYQLRLTSPGLSAANTNTFTLSKVADLSLSFADTAYSPNQLVTPNYSTDSPGTPVYSTTTPSTVCTVNTANGQVTIKGVGDCQVRVVMPSTTYYIGTNVTATLRILKAVQSALSITSANNVNYLGTLSLTATGGSGTGALSYFVNGDCKLVGTTLIPGNAGANVCSVIATRAGDANYQDVLSSAQQITINKIAQATLRLVNVTTIPAGTLDLVTAGGSGSGAITYTATGSANCTVTGNTLTAAQSGSCSVIATKAASTNYTTIDSAAQTITVTKQEQIVRFTTAVPMYPTITGSYDFAATASSGLAVAYSITSGNNTI